MKKVDLKKTWLRRARDFQGLSQIEREGVDKFLDSLSSSVATVDVNLNDFPKSFWRGILREAQLPANVRTLVALHVYGMRESNIRLEQIYEMEVESPLEFGSSFQVSGQRAPNCEMFLNGRWYPVLLTVKFIEDGEKLTRAVLLGCRVELGEKTFGLNNTISRDVFLDEKGELHPRKVIDVLELLGYRRLQTPAAEQNLRLVKAERLSSEHGRVVMVTGSVITPSRFSWWAGFETRNLGSAEMSSRCVVEDALEVDSDHRSYYGGYEDEESKSKLPFVRLFSLETKAYVYADIDDIEIYEFDHLALNRLHLPEKMHSILARVFGTPIEMLFGDLLRGKHGGAVVLASGDPGVGKTLTAEIYAESNERPLYVLELGELGTKASEVEGNLQLVFARVTRWNAVLQFDECEIFLAQRGNDLERSAIVGIFLRLLDYYRGLLFLTTNRPEVLDAAVLSRVMLRLNYPRLDAATRTQIWRTMFEHAHLKLTDEVRFEQLGEIELNGRQIRNLTRLAKILYPQHTIGLVGIRETLQFGCGIAFDQADMQEDARSHG